MNKDITLYTFFKKLIDLLWIEEIWLYGSRARGDNESRSDIDLAIVCPKASNLEWLKIVEIIEKADTLLEIDCVRLDEVKDGPFRDCVYRDKKILFSRERRK